MLSSCRLPRFEKRPLCRSLSVLPLQVARDQDRTLDVWHNARKSLRHLGQSPLDIILGVFHLCGLTWSTYDFASTFSESERSLIDRVSYPSVEHEVIQCRIMKGVSLGGSIAACGEWAHKHMLGNMGGALASISLGSIAYGLGSVVSAENVLTSMQDVVEHERAVAEAKKISPIDDFDSSRMMRLLNYLSHVCFMTFSVVSLVGVLFGGVLSVISVSLLVVGLIAAISSWLLSLGNERQEELIARVRMAMTKENVWRRFCEK